MTFKYIIYKYRLKLIFSTCLIFALCYVGLEIWDARQRLPKLQPRSSTPEQQQPLVSGAPIQPPTPRADGDDYGLSWEWNYERDANYRSLTKEQCAIAFPNNTYQIEDAVRRLGGRKITDYDLSVANDRLCVRALVYNQEMFIQAGGVQDDSYMSWRWEERIIGTMSLIHEAISAARPGTIPNLEFAWCSDDDTLRAHRRSVMGYNRHYAWEDQKEIWVIPDFGYWSWQVAMAESYRDLRRRMQHITENAKWADKIPQILWRGDPGTNKIRKDLMRATEGKEWADVGPCQNDLCHVTMPEHCKYKFLAHTEGVTYSGRLKMLLNCKSLVFAHQLNWIEHHTHLLKSEGPEQNFIQVERDWSDLEEKVDYYTKHPDEADAIATRAYNLFAKRYLTPAAIACYFRSMFDAWAQQLDYEPQLYRNGSDGKIELNGVPYELYVVGRNFIYKDSPDGRQIKHHV